MKKTKIINFILLILWLVVIFTMSSFNASESGSQSNFVVNFICKLLSIHNTRYLSLFIRKIAHFSEYFILGILSLNVLKDYIRNKKVISISIALCILYAISDEIHQFYVPGRVCSIVDILIDSLGALAGIVIYHYLKIKKVISFEK